MKKTRKFWKNALSLVIMIGVLFTAVPLADVLAADTTIEISTVQDLLAFADRVNSGEATLNAVLKANIKLNDQPLSADSTVWTPIGSKTNPYSGTFDSGSYTISGLYITSGDYVGLFGFVSGGTIKNIKITDSDVKGKMYIGGVCGYIEKSTITSCSYAGVISDGAAANSNNEVYIGGVCGYVVDSSAESCTNTGAISAATDTKDSDSVYIGGVFGRFGTNATETANLKNCVNKGTVSVTGKRSPKFIGGICGSFNKIKVENCQNIGAISASGENEIYGGGLVGSCSSGEISNCTNSGTISATSAKNAYTGGIYGWGNSIIANGCNNSGTITASSDYVDAGGICGKSEESSTISNSINTASVTATGTKYSPNAGGVVGQCDAGSGGSLTIKSCSNSGKITAIPPTAPDPYDIKTYAGGIIASITSAEGVEIKGCFNAGIVGVTGNNAIADSICAGEKSSGKFENCVYLADKETAVSNGICAKTTAQFASGEAAYLLGNDWGQNLSSESFPVLGGMTVYRYEIKNCNSTSKNPPMYGYSNTSMGTQVEEHKWGKWQITTAPTETEKGEATRTCSACDGKQTAELSNLNDRSFWALGDYVPPTTKQEGSRKYENSTYGTVTVKLPKIPDESGSEITTTEVSTPDESGSDESGSETPAADTELASNSTVSESSAVEVNQDDMPIDQTAENTEESSNVKSNEEEIEGTSDNSPAIPDEPGNDNPHTGAGITTGIIVAGLAFIAIIATSRKKRTK